MRGRVLYLAERGCYEQRNVVGVFDSAERAMAALPGGKWTRTVWTNFPDYPDLSRVHHWQDWSNGLDWEDACRVTSVEVTDTGPTRTVDEVLEQRLNASGGWDYIPISAAQADSMIGDEP